MIRNLLFTLFCSFLTVSLFAQAISFTQDEINLSGYPDEFELVAHTSVLNNTNEAIDLTWVRVQNETTNPLWNVLVCDTNQCWSPSVNSKEFSIPANGSANLDVHFQTQFEGGGASVQLVVYAASDSLGTAIVGTFGADIWATGINEPSFDDVRIYPNPVRSKLNLDLAGNDVERIEIFNLIGKKVGEYFVNDAYSIIEMNTFDFDEGMYFLSLYNRDNQLVQSKMFSKVN